MLGLLKKRGQPLKCAIENRVEQNNYLEKKERKNFKSGDVSTFSFFWMQLVSFIPVINIVPLLFWSFNSKVNKNKRSFARSNLIWCCVFMFFILFIFLTLVFLKYPCNFSFWFKKFEKLLIEKIK